MKFIVLSAKLQRCVLELAASLISVLISLVGCELQQRRRWAVL